MSGIVGQCVFAILVILACVEKIAAVVNLVAVERDWVCLGF